MNETMNKNETNAPLPSTGIANFLGKKIGKGHVSTASDGGRADELLTAQLGIKQKSLFDYLMEDTDALHAVAASRPTEAAIEEQRIQKTFVVSQQSLAVLDTVAKRAAASRNEWKGRCRDSGTGRQGQTHIRVLPGCDESDPPKR